MSRTTIDHAARLALVVQNSKNLSVVVRSFAEAMTEVWAEANRQSPHPGTEWINTHPVAVLFAHKVCALTGYTTGSTRENHRDAVAACEKLLAEEP